MKLNPQPEKNMNTPTEAEKKHACDRQVERDTYNRKNPVGWAEQRDTAQHSPLPKLQVDECPDCNGFTTIRVHDGTRNGNTEVQPIATVYDVYNACLIVRAVNNVEALAEALKDIAEFGRSYGLTAENAIDGIRNKARHALARYEEGKV